jgi:HAE1 family hydrophobic/amphiphilic exporter-1
MEEVTGPIIATTIVLMAVFIPTAFIQGVTGKLYAQFALTIATATVFSAVNALTLSPVLSALLLRPTSRHQNSFTRIFNRVFYRAQGRYLSGVSFLMRRAFFAVILFAGLSGAALWGLISLPTGFVPVEDQGWAMLSVQLPDAATRQRTLGVMDKVNENMAGMEGVKGWICLTGFSLMDGASASNAAAVWIVFDPWEERLEKGLTLDAMLGGLRMRLAGIQDASIFAFAPPAIRGLGTAGGFQMQLQDRAGAGPDELQQVVGELTGEANSKACLARVFSTFRANIPQLFVDIDRTKAKALGIELTEIFHTLQAFMGSVYVNDFNRFGKTYQVRVQADAGFRDEPEDIRQLQVRNDLGKMVPLGAVLRVKKELGPLLVNRFNMYPSAMISGTAARGFSSGEAMAMMEALAETRLPPSMGIEWTGMSFQEKAAGGQVLLFVLAILLAYLVLSALYESWSLPFVVILAVPPALLGTTVAVAMGGMEVNVYTRVGITLLIALSCKTAILIAEFARDARRAGKSVPEAALEAATLRFRPIVMTASTFILGVVPLVFATGAGAASRKALGTAVFGGMIAATLMIVLFVPVFYLIMEKKRSKNG